jgi:phage repressor protein C with HTH and peptisase S24 domain
MALGTNIATLRRLAGVSLERLATALGTSAQTIHNLEVRDSARSSYAAQLSQFFNVDLLTLLEGTTEELERVWQTSNDFAAKQPASLKPEGQRRTPEQDSLPNYIVAIPESEVLFTAGNGHTADYEVIEDAAVAYYRRDWLIQERLNPAHLKRVRVRGDSMEPLLYDGDRVLVNLAEIDVADGRVYALRYGAELRIKRVLRHLDGTLILRSDNKFYGDEIVPAALANEHIQIVGRIRDRSGTAGL